ncbi:MAG: TadE/TadG family type IV pilus assembly protein [Croceibacterium sp.]
MIEFAILAPAVIAMMLGVLYVGMALQNYNALRGLSADVARYAMIQYARGNRMNDAQLQTYALSVGDGAPYLFDSTLRAVVGDAANQRVSGATEKTLTLTYQIPTLVESLGLRGPQISFARPVFLPLT